MHYLGATVEHFLVMDKYSRITLTYVNRSAAAYLEGTNIALSHSHDSLCERALYFDLSIGRAWLLERLGNWKGLIKREPITVSTMNSFGVSKLNRNNYHSCIAMVVFKHLKRLSNKF